MVSDQSKIDNENLRKNEDIEMPTMVSYQQKIFDGIENCETSVEISKEKSKNDSHSSSSTNAPVEPASNSKLNESVQEKSINQSKQVFKSPKAGAVVTSMSHFIEEYDTATNMSNMSLNFDADDLLLQLMPKENSKEDAEENQKTSPERNGNKEKTKEKKLKRISSEIKEKNQRKTSYNKNKMKQQSNSSPEATTTGATTNTSLDEKIEEKCAVCNKIFTDPQKLLKHLKTHQEGPIENAPNQVVPNTGIDRLSCKICGKTFVDKYTLIRHEKTQHDKLVYNKNGSHSVVHACPICNKKFGMPSKLNRHMRTHTGEQPYKCICGTGFGDYSSFKRHAKRKGCYSGFGDEIFENLASAKIDASTLIKIPTCIDSSRKKKNENSSNDDNNKINSPKKSGVTKNVENDKKTNINENTSQLKKKLQSKRKESDINLTDKQLSPNITTTDKTSPAVIEKLTLGNHMPDNFRQFPKKDSKIKN